MKVLVPVKQIARLRDGDVPDGTGSLAPEALERGLNEWDPFSLEAALRLVEQEGSGEVVVATVAEESAEEALRACLAMGAGRAIRIWDPALEQADALAVAAVLAGLARRERPELILCGAQSSDRADAATGVALAGLLDLARVAVVSGVEREGAALAVQRELDGGAVELLRIRTPALLTIQTGIHEPRRANLRAIRQAREQPLERLGIADVGLDAAAVGDASAARTVRLLERDRSKGASMLEGSAGEIAGRIAEILAEAVAP